MGIRPPWEVTSHRSWFPMGDAYPMGQAPMGISIPWVRGITHGRFLISNGKDMLSYGSLQCCSHGDHGNFTVGKRYSLHFSEQFELTRPAIGQKLAKTPHGARPCVLLSRVLPICPLLELETAGPQMIVGRHRPAQVMPAVGELESYFGG